MKKLIVVILIVSLLLLTACGAEKAEVPAEEAPAASTAEETPTEAETPAEAPAEDKELSEGDFVTKSLGDNTCEITGCLNYVENVIVPENIAGMTVKGIASGAFTSGVVVSVTLPDSVEYLKDYAFDVCDNLKAVNLGSGLKAVGTQVFNACPVLESITFPDGMTTMGICAFGFCDSLKEVYIPASVTEIDEVITYGSLCPNIIIVTPAGSTAETVASANGLPVQNS